MSFKYVICIDVEATCWPGKYTRKQDAEIIEIGATLLNVITGETEDQFHRYIRPTLFPKLSAFCINLVGIKQDLIDLQNPFPKVYDEFLEWINGIKTEKDLIFATTSLRRVTDADDSPNITFCSWSNFDLNCFLKMELERAHINIPPFFKTWIDARRLFDQKYYMGRCTFSDALKRVGVQAVGNAHSGIDDATNLAKLMAHLIKKGIQCKHATDYYL